VVGSVVLAGAIGLGAYLLLQDGPEQPASGGRPAPAAKPSPSPSPSPTGIPGIDESVTVEGADVVLTSAELVNSYTSEFSNETFRPTDPQDTLLVVSGTVEGVVGDVHDWKVNVSDESGRRDTPGLTSSTAEGDSVDVVWVFVVDGNADTLVLKLPDNVRVDLTPLLG
jgi:hypothetical protein